MISQRENDKRRGWLEPAQGGPPKLRIPEATLAAIDLAIKEGRHSEIDLMADFRRCDKCRRWADPSFRIDNLPGTLCAYCAVAVGEARWL